MMKCTIRILFSCNQDPVSLQYHVLSDVYKAIDHHPPTPGGRVNAEQLQPFVHLKAIKSVYPSVAPQTVVA
jgi:hypothetical protein